MHKGSALMYPVGGRALHAKNAIAFFAKHARFEPSADFAFAASKRTAKTEGFLREEHQTCRDRPPGLSVPMRNNLFYPNIWVAKRREGSE